MEELMIITQVTKLYGVTTRMLRYYEEIGLLQSQHIEGYSYRAYDQETCQKLEQIIVLRKLRIPLKQIAVILNDNDISKIVSIFMNSIHELNLEIESLSTIRDILTKLVNELKRKTGIFLKMKLLNDANFLSLISPLPIINCNFKEGNRMDDLNKSNEQLGKLSDREVRIIQLPKATIATYRYVGDDPEMHVNQVIDQFVRDNDLIYKKPDLRHYGFNSPNPVDETGYHGYEIWVTIPDDVKVPAPLEKKVFDGGLYAAFMIPFGAFDEWRRLYEWVESSTAYEYRGNWDKNNMFGCMEEHLNYVNHVMLENTEPEGMQLDLLIPIKERSVK